MPNDSSHQIKHVPTEDLHFDNANPRLAEYGITKDTSEDEILKILWDAMDVRELVHSISASGFFPHEALIIAPEDDQTIVIEGNRRLAAVKILLDLSIAKKHGWEVPPLSATQLDDLKALPTIMSARQDAWRFLGFKHANDA